MTWAHMCFDPLTQTSDAVLDDNGFISLGGGLETPVGASLFSNVRAFDTDNVGNKGGWWGDTYAELEGQKLGSRFWIIRQTQGVSLRSLRLLRAAAEASLQWMIALSLTEEIQASVERLGVDSAIIRVSSRRPTGETWSYVWEVHQNAVR